MKPAEMMFCITAVMSLLIVVCLPQNRLLISYLMVLLLKWLSDTLLIIACAVWAKMHHHPIFYGDLLPKYRDLITIKMATGPPAVFHCYHA